MTILALIAALAPPACAAWPVFRSGPEAAPLLELYSSEGCSSCPPADAFMSSLLGHPGLWTEFVPVVFHVDYWDYLGWKDPLASPLFTRRQKSLGRLVTPGFILDGKPWWSRDLGGLKRSTRRAGRLEVRPEGLLRFRIEYPPAKEGAWRAHAALLGFGAVSAVSSGENAGATLRHDFAALGYGSAAIENGSALVMIAPNLGVKPASFGVAAWVSREGDPAPVQAAGGFLEARGR